MSGKTIGIDMGTKNLKLYRQGEGVVFDQQNVVAIQRKKKVLAIGNEAADMLEKAPEDIEVIYPMQHGVVANINSMIQLLNKCWRTLFFRPKWVRGQDFLVAIPTDVTEVEKRAFVELILDSDVRPHSVKMVDKPICAALGAGLDVTSAYGIMTIDIGAATTEIAVMSLGGLVLSRNIKVGGNQIDNAIKQAVKKAYHLYIGDKTAETIKKELAHAVPGENITKKVYGRDVVTGLPLEAEVTSEMVHQAIKEHLRTIVDSIRISLERTPPEISSDIMESGIYVVGGCAGIAHLSEMLQDETDLKVHVVPDSENAVIKGLGVIIEDASLAGLAYEYRQPNYAVRTKG